MMEKPDRGELLLLAVSRMNRLQIDELGKLDTPLTLRQYRILQRISQGHTSLSELGKLAHRSLPTMSESTDGLIRRKLLTRRVLASDRRSVVLSLTKSGERALAAGNALMEELSEGFFARLPATKRTVLEQISRQMYDYAADVMGWDGRGAGHE